MSRSYRGACFSPFIRAYVAELNNHGIDQDTFVGFIDGLNEAFVAHPIFEAINIASTVVSIAAPLPDVHFAFGGLAVGAVVAGRATSYARTKAYLKAINTNLFNPAGLKVSLMTTEKMMEEIGCGENTLNLPPLNTFADFDEEAVAEPLNENQSTSMTHPDDPRVRRIRALSGYVMPLNFDVPPPVAARENFLKRMGDAHVNWLSRRQQKSLTKKREKAIEKDFTKQQKLEEKRLQGEQEIARLERERDFKQNEMQSKVTSEKTMRDPGEEIKVIQALAKQSDKIQRQIDKEQNKLEDLAEKRGEEGNKNLRKKEEREEKIAQKIRWLVIAKWDGEENETDLSKVTSESSEI